MDNIKKQIISGLRWLEKYTKTDMVYLVRGGSWLGAGQIVSTVSAFLLSLAFANLLPADSYGTYKYILSINALLAIPTLAGINAAVTQAVAKKHEGTVFLGMMAKMRWGSLGSILSIIISTYYYFQGNTTLCLAFLTTAIFLPFTESFDLYNALLQGKKLFKTFTIFNSLTQLLSVTSLVITIFFTHNVLIILLVFLLSNTLLNGIFFIATFFLNKPNNDIDTSSITYGKKLSGLYIVSLVANELDKLLVFHYLGATSLAIYTVAIAPTEQLKAILKNIQFLVLPKMAENIDKDIRSNVFKKTYLLAGLVSVCVIFYIFLSPYVFKIAFSKYPESIFYSQLISISLVAAVTSPIFYLYLEVKRSTKGLLNFHIFSNVINILSLFLGVYFFGLIGVIASRIFSRFSVLLLTAILAKNT